MVRVKLPETASLVELFIARSFLTVNQGDLLVKRGKTKVEQAHPHQCFLQVHFHHTAPDRQQCGPEIAANRHSALESVAKCILDASIYLFK